jgi:hypothetical protein
MAEAPRRLSQRPHSYFIGQERVQWFFYLYFSTVHTQIEGSFKFEDDPGKTNNLFSEQPVRGKA